MILSSAFELDGRNLKSHGVLIIWCILGQKPMNDWNQTEMDTQNKETDQGQEETVDVGKST